MVTLKLDVETGRNWETIARAANQEQQKTLAFLEKVQEHGADFQEWAQEVGKAEKRGIHMDYDMDGGLILLEMQVPGAPEPEETLKELEEDKIGLLYIVATTWQDTNLTITPFYSNAKTVKYIWGLVRHSMEVGYPHPGPDADPKQLIDDYYSQNADLINREWEVELLTLKTFNP